MILEDLINFPEQVLRGLVWIMSRNSNFQEILSDLPKPNK